jgi:hypothetical protein
MIEQHWKKSYWWLGWAKRCGSTAARGTAMKVQGDKQTIDATTANGAADVEAHVQCLLGRRLRNFRVVVRDEGIVLRGQTSTYYAKQLAQQAVLEATLLPIFANDIDVT